MSRLRAPTARRVPIWRVRAVHVEGGEAEDAERAEHQHEAGDHRQRDRHERVAGIAAAACMSDILRSLPTTRFGSRLRSATSTAAITRSSSPGSVRTM